MRYSFLISMKQSKHVFLSADIDTSKTYFINESLPKTVLSNMKLESIPTGKLVGFKNKKPVFTPETLKKFKQDNKKLYTILLIAGENRNNYIFCNDEGNLFIKEGTVELKKLKDRNSIFTNISEDFKLSLKGFEEGKDIPIIKATKLIKLDTKSSTKNAKNELKKLTREELFNCVKNCMPVNAYELIRNKDWSELLYGTLRRFETYKNKIKDFDSEYKFVSDYIKKVFRDANDIDCFEEQVEEVSTNNKRYTLKDMGW